MYHSLCDQFATYINTTAHTKFRISGITTTQTCTNSCEVLDEITKDIEYKHRWTQSYRRGWLAKLYQLDTWFQKNPGPVTMLTLTTYQDGEYSKKMCNGKSISREESFVLLKEGWKLLSMIIRKELGYSPDYLTIMEPHGSGYPHMHIPIFCVISPELRTKITRLWADKYQFGSAEHGINFEVRETQDNIKNIRNYLMKYLAKGFLNNSSKFGDAGLSVGELIFNTLIWKYKYRIFGSSRKLSQIMKYHKPLHNAPNPFEETPTDVVWLATDIITPHKDIYPVWKSSKSNVFEKHGLALSQEEQYDITTGFRYVRHCFKKLNEKIKPKLENLDNLRKCSDIQQTIDNVSFFNKPPLTENVTQHRTKYFSNTSI